MSRRRRSSRGALVEALMGAASGVVASWVMEQAQRRIWTLGGRETLEREKLAQGDLPPATVQAAEGAARLVGTSLPERWKGPAAQAVHYATGAAFGALFGVLARRVPAPVLAAGALYGVAVWLVNDETLVPALRLSRTPWKYPASSHAKALAAHLVYGATTGAGLRLFEAAVR